MARVLCSGSFMCDIIAADLPRLGDPGDLIYAPHGIQIHPGGHAANVAIDLAQLGQTEIAVTGGLGEDLFGDFMEDQLVRLGIEVHAQRMTDVPTSKNVVLVVKDEDRRFYAELAANTMLSPEHVGSALEETRPKVFYQGTVGGLRLIDPVLDQVLGQAREAGALTFVDVVYPTEGAWRNLRGSLHLIDLLHCNLRESEALTGEGDPSKAADALAQQGVKLAMVTMGSRGLIASTGEAKLRVPAFNVDTLDTTGAGDAFCAGVISSILESEALLPSSRRELTETLLRGAAAGAVCVTATGAPTAVTMVNVQKLIAEQVDELRTRVERL
ncbi:putative sugar kinase YdjH [subsurface metagenome]